MNHNFSEPIGMHATYMSLYVALAMASFLRFLLQEKNKKEPQGIPGSHSYSFSGIVATCIKISFNCHYHFYHRSSFLYS